MITNQLAMSPTAHLEVNDHDGLRRVLFHAGEISIGRHPDNVLPLEGEDLSRRHCVIRAAEGVGWMLRDLGSRNGTRVNGRRELDKALVHGDFIKVGKTVLRFVSEPFHRNVEIASPRAFDQDLGGSAGRNEVEVETEKTVDLNVDLAAIVRSRKESPLRSLHEVCSQVGEERDGLADIFFFDARGRHVHADDRGDDESRKNAIALFRATIQAAIRCRATDIHVEPRSEGVSIRFRVDGQMVKITRLEKTSCARILGITKVLCEIDSSSRASVQEGHFSAGMARNRIDFRVSLTPVVHGQKLVIRVLDAAIVPSRLHELGLVPWMHEKVRKVAVRDSGMLLVSGPTGSGKTTTLHSCLREIDVEARNAITIEDPVEYQLDGATQISVDHQQGHGFATILRSVLRQDPDVIFVGEIRDGHGRVPGRHDRSPRLQHGPRPGFDRGGLSFAGPWTRALPGRECLEPGHGPETGASALQVLPPQDASNLGPVARPGQARRGGFQDPSAPRLLGMPGNWIPRSAGGL